MKNLKEWFSIKELMDENLIGLPASDKGIVKKADRENWVKRQREGVKGKTFEYHYSSFPLEIQKELGFYPTEMRMHVPDIAETAGRYIKEAIKPLSLLACLFIRRSLLPALGRLMTTCMNRMILWG